MTSTIFKFTHVSRRAFARLPRASKNGTPEERAAAERAALARRLAEEIIEATRPERTPTPSATGKNERLRMERREAWRTAEAAMHYWRGAIKF
jgi:hypothetical protein